MADGVGIRLNGVSYTAQQERLMNGLHLMPNSTGSGLSVREGKRLGAGLEVTVSANGLNAEIQAGSAAVSAAVASGGDYVVTLPAMVSKVLPAKPGVGLKRRDTVVLDVLDADVVQKPTALRECNVLILQGTATAGTPVAPVADLMQFEVGQIAYDGNNTPTVNPTSPRYTWAAGGVGVVFSQTERDNLAAYDGLKVYRDDLDVWQQRRAGAWEDEGGQDTGWVLGDAVPDVFGTLSAFWNDTGSRIRRIGNRVRLEINVTREGSALGPGDFTDSDVHFISDATYHPATGGRPLFFHGQASGGVVSFKIDEDGNVTAISSDELIDTGNSVRAVGEWYTD